MVMRVNVCIDVKVEKLSGFPATYKLLHEEADAR
jgi:hypothetical protein